ncbi:hypothetical protein [Nostoc sp.]|uniref:hypothetical protein n=1 Tax=Nostoc sp. TaxID=1180 RepID=UPI002FF1EEA0
MVQQLYSRQQLEKLSINELRKVCDAKGVLRRRSREDCIVDILAAQSQLKAQFKNVTSANWICILRFYITCRTLKLESAAQAAARYLRQSARAVDEQAVAQTELEVFIEEQADVVAPEQQRLEMNQQGYRDAVEGLVSQSADSCYRVGYERGIRDITPTTEDLGSEALAFDKVADGRWQATVNGVLVRIAAVGDGYKTNLTDDAVLVDFGIAIKESLLGVARLQAKPEKPEFEIFTTRLPNVFAVHSRKSGQRYEVYPDSGCCTCPHWLHRHEQEGFKDKHLEAVRAVLQSGIPLMREPQTDTGKLIEKFTDEFGWIGGGQIASARVWLESRFGNDFEEAILSGEARNKALQLEEQMDKEMANW